MAEAQGYTEEELKNRLQFMQDAKKYAENMAIPDKERYWKLDGQMAKFREQNDREMYDYLGKLQNWVQQHPSSDIFNGRQHFVKNLKPTMTPSSFRIGKIDNQFYERDSDFSDEKLYGSHRWKLGKDVNEPGFATGMDTHTHSVCSIL